MMIFFFGLAWGAGSETEVSSLPSFARIVFAQSMTVKGQAREARDLNVGFLTFRSAP
jgi:hypothetical protein